MAFLSELGTSLSHISKDTFVPALSEAGRALHAFGQTQLTPALAGAAIGLDAFGKEKLIPAMRGLGKYGKETLGPKVKEAGEYVRQNAGPAMRKTGEYVKESAGPAMKKTGEYVKDNAGPAMKKTAEYVKANPGKTAMYSASGLTMLTPGLVSGPVLWAFGWGGVGVRAGSAAAAIQASVGNVVAGSSFATLQSAAMGGAGGAVVNGAVQGCSLAMSGAGWLFGLANQTSTP